MEAEPVAENAEEAPALAPRLYRIETVAERLDVSVRYVWQLIAEGQLPAVRMTRRRTLIRDDDLAAYINKHTERAS